MSYPRRELIGSTTFCEPLATYYVGELPVLGDFGLCRNVQAYRGEGSRVQCGSQSQCSRLERLGCSCVANRLIRCVIADCKRKGKARPGTMNSSCSDSLFEKVVGACKLRASVS